MKILHCCLANFYIDGYAYQENILPKMHQKQGHEVKILASTETYIDNRELGYVSPKPYKTPDGIPITRIPYVKWLPHFLVKRLRIYHGMLEEINSFKPDIIFLHDVQFLSITKIVEYVKNNKSVRLYADGHADFIKHKGRNKILNWFSQEILHGQVYKWCAQKVKPFTEKFYGVLPVRVEFFKKIYGIPEEKVELLVMGADDTEFDLSNSGDIRKRIRNPLNITNDDFLIVTGGKIDGDKKITTLIRAVNELEKKDIKLLTFGKPNWEMQEEFDCLVDSNDRIKNVGWIDSEKVYDYFIAADLGFFPGTHSVLWEQAVGVGLPCVFKRWDGVGHVDLDGNCLFINEPTTKEIKNTILKIYNNEDLLKSMKRTAKEKGIPTFSYFNIAKRAIEA